MVISPFRKVPKLRVLRSSMNGKLICIPTVHIWGLNNTTIELSKGRTSTGDERDGLDVISGLRVPGLRETCMHNGEHIVPGVKMNAAVKASVRPIRRVLSMTEEV